MNGHINYGELKNGAHNGADANWLGASALVGYKFTPSLQGLVRVDMLNNTKNGGGVYANNYRVDKTGQPGGDTEGTGLGPVLDASGNILDPNQGANLARLSLGVNYTINPFVQWKTEWRMDQSTGYNFTDSNGVPTKKKTMLGTSLVFAF